MEAFYHLSFAPHTAGPCEGGGLVLYEGYAHILFAFDVCNRVQRFFSRRTGLCCVMGPCAC